MKIKPKKQQRKKGLVEVSLTDIGMTGDQALVYKTLLSSGPSKAFRLAFQSGLKRALTYKVLGQLEELGLVESRNVAEEKVATFFPTHPSNLEELINKKKTSVAVAENAFTNIVMDLTASYNVANKKPNVRFWEGIEGINRVHDDIILENTNILIFRSAFDKTSENLTELIEENVRRRARKGIRTRAITPPVDPKNKSITLGSDEKNLVERRLIDVEKFNLPAQIIVYGNKVAITSYKDQLMTTIIENNNIRDSVAILFELAWTHATKIKGF